MKLIALKEVYYASKTRNAGEEFDASDTDARILIGVEKAKAANAIETRVMRPEPVVEAPVWQEAKAEEVKPEDPPKRSNIDPLTGRRRYRRRDMKPEE